MTLLLVLAKAGAATQDADPLTAAAFFVVMCLIAAALAGLADWLTKRGDARTDRARRELERRAFFDRERLP